MEEKNHLDFIAHGGQKQNGKKPKGKFLRLHLLTENLQHLTKVHRFYFNVQTKTCLFHSLHLQLSYELNDDKV